MVKMSEIRSGGSVSTQLWTKFLFILFNILIYIQYIVLIQNKSYDTENVQLVKDTVFDISHLSQRRSPVNKPLLMRWEQSVSSPANSVAIMSSTIFLVVFHLPSYTLYINSSPNPGSVFDAHLRGVVQCKLNLNGLYLREPARQNLKPNQR